MVWRVGGQKAKYFGDAKSNGNEEAVIRGTGTVPSAPESAVAVRPQVISKDNIGPRRGESRQKLEGRMA